MFHWLKFLSIVFIAYTIAVMPQKKFLFDATHGEMAGNADWIIDTDTKDKPQRYPTPDQSTVTASTPENYWTGALSSWGIGLVKLGYKVETLPIGTAITYGNTSNAQDLSNYDVFIVDEPNNQFSASEKTAILNFVKNGGGLFMISDHDNSDRDNDGYDSPAVWNDLMTSNTVKTNPFGISIDLLSFNDKTTNILAPSTADPVIAGPQGNVVKMQISAGTTATLNTTANSTVTGVIWKTGATKGGTTSVLAAHAEFGTGRVVFVGDSSPAEDTTSQSGNTTYSGWNFESDGCHAIFFLNGSQWLAKVTGTVTNIHNKVVRASEFALSQNYPNPFNPTTTIGYNLPSGGFVSLKVYDMLGNEVANLVNDVESAGNHFHEFNAAHMPSGTYVYRLSSGGFSETKKMILMK